ncbi:MAG: hypothetical protein HY236_13525 [Acidobacteria bacterium]|nr:hypothetical protein [Acidobacteriota bacterium]
MRRPAARREPRREQGYALLVVLFLGAVMAILVALSLPRAAFEAQRGKEDELIYRGGQYSRAIQLYFRKFHKYPARMEELENTNNVRFLRKKYEDPITKKDDWRIIHIGPAGVFTDSQVYDKPKKKPEGESGSENSPPGPETSGTASPGAGQITGMADRLRAGVNQQPPNPSPDGAPLDSSEGTNPGQPQSFGSPLVSAPGNQPAGVPGQPGASPASAGGPQGMAVGTGASGLRFPGPGGMAQVSPFQGGPGAPGGQAFPGPGGFGASPAAGGAGFPGAGGFGSGPGVGNEAARIIGQILTSPRPGGLQGLQGGGPGGLQSGSGGSNLFGGSGGNLFGGAAGGSTFGGGIAGVASKAKERGIKVYLEQETYNHWEFVYDYRKDTSMVGAMGVIPQNPPGQPAHPSRSPGQPGPIIPVNPNQPGLQR